MARYGPIVRLTKKPKTDLRTEKKLPAKSRKGAQLVSNFSSYATPIVDKNKLTLGNVSNPYEAIHFSPVLSLGKGSWVECLQTWRNAGEQISEMSAESLITQEEKSNNTTYLTPPELAPESSLGKVTSFLQTK